MKILYIITGLRLGGAENQLLLLAANMQRANNDVLVVAMESGGIVGEEMRNQGIQVAELNISNIKSLWSGYSKFKKIVTQFLPDIIHSHLIHANLFARVFKLFNTNFKLISTAHNITEGSKIMMFGYTLTRSIPNWSTNVSQEAFKFYIDKGYFKAGQSSYIPNAIDTHQFDPDLFDTHSVRNELNIPPGAFVFFSAGRLHQQKNFPMLIEAFKLAANDAEEAVLVIAGEGPLADELKLLCIRLGIGAKIHFLGRRNDIAALMIMCNCFVLSSKYEGFGLVIGEAMAMKKPVIATDCGGVKEVMGGYGQLINIGDVKALANAMVKVSGSSNDMTRLDAGRKHIESNYAVNEVISKWINLYTAL